MDNKLEYQVLIMQALNDKLASEFNKIKYDMKKIYYDSTKMRSDMNEIKTILTQIMSQKWNPSPDNMDSSKAQDTSTELTAYKKTPPLEGRHSTKIVACGLSDIISYHQNYMNSS